MHNLATNGGILFERDTEQKSNLVDIFQMISNGILGKEPVLENLLNRIERTL